MQTWPQAAREAGRSMAWRILVREQRRASRPRERVVGGSEESGGAQEERLRGRLGTRSAAQEEGWRPGK